MRRLLPFVAFLYLFLCATAAIADRPSPTFNNVTVNSNITAGGSLSVAGATTLSGGGTLSGTFNGAAAFTNISPTLSPFTVSSLPSVTSANSGRVAFVSDCVNGSQSAPGSGCLYFVNTNGIWTAMPSPSNLALTIGGQSVSLGGSTANQGNGPLIQLAVPGFVVGHAPAYDNNGNLVDSGVVPSGGTGGGGTVAGAPQKSIAFYTNAGTASTVGGLAIVNNAVLVTNSGGTPSEATTLPGGLTIPSPTITSPTLGGTISIGGASYTGRQVFFASTLASASINIPSGVTPSSPVNGDFWTLNTGVFARVNGTTQGPFLYQVNTSGPLGGGGNGPTLTLTCATCATTTNGGLLTATSPMAISAAGVISLGGQPSPVTWIADATTVVHNDTYNIYEKWPFSASGTINSVVYHTGGTTSPSFAISLQINGSNVTGCTTLPVSSTSDTTTTCTGLNTITNGQTLGLVVSGVAGSPSSAVVQVNMTKPAS